MEQHNFSNSRMIGKTAVDFENKRVSVVLSEETEVVRYSWNDGKYFITLLHGEENIDLSRKDILAVFINHNTYDLPIGIWENVRIEDKKLKAEAVFDEDDEESMKIFNKLAKGFLKSFSVGISIQDRVLAREEDDIKYYNATKWAIDECSVVGIPAITGAKVGLEKQVLGDNPASAQIENNDKGVNMEFTKEKFDALQLQHKADLTNARAEAAKEEQTRVFAIMALGGNQEFTAKAIEDGTSVGDSAIALLKVNKEAQEKAKTDFEAAADEVDGVDQGKSEDLTKEQLEAKSWDDAAEKKYGVKK